MKKQFTELRKEDHMNNIDNILSQLQDGLKDLYESEKYKQYLDTMAKFHK